MSFRVLRQISIGVVLGGILLTGAHGEGQEQSQGLGPEAVAGPHCLRYVHAEVLDDPRTDAVREFLDSHKCKITDLAADFVLAADLNNLDYRLLPTLSVLETGCGRGARNNNLFGWANGRKPFASFRQGIHHVAQRLRLAPHYAGKTLKQKLKLYNRRPRYQKKVLAVMEQMPPATKETTSDSE